MEILYLGLYMRKYAKRSSRRPFRRPRRKSAYKPKKSYVKRKGMFRKKSSMNVIRVKNDGISQTFSQTNTSMTRFKAMMRKKYWLGAKNIYKQVYPLSMRLAPNAINGAQQQYYINYLFDRGSMYNALATDTTAGNLQPSNGIGQNSNVNRIFWNRCICEYTLNNVANTPVFVDIYRFKPKRDCGVYIDSAWEDGLEDENNSGGASVLFVNDWGANPLDSVKLTTYYKCVNITRIVMQPGQLHVHKHDIHVSMPVNNELINQTTGANTFYRGITEVDLFVVRGPPVSAVDTYGSVTSAPTCVVALQNATYEFKYIWDQAISYSYFNGEIENNANTNVYNQGSGAIESATIGAA